MRGLAACACLLLATGTASAQDYVPGTTVKYPDYNPKPSPAPGGGLLTQPASPPVPWIGPNASGFIDYPLSPSVMNYVFNGVTYGQMGGNITNDPWSAPSLIRLGGVSQSTPMSLQVNGMTEGENDLGAVLSTSYNDGVSSSNRPGLGPDLLSAGVPGGMNYGSFDGATFTNQIASAVATVRAGQDVKDWEGNTHAVTFGCMGSNTRICFTPALPNEWVIRLHRGENMATNVVGPHNNTTCAANTVCAPPTLSSQVNAWDPAGAWVDTTGWVVLGGGINPYAANGSLQPPASYTPMKTAWSGANNGGVDVAAGTINNQWITYPHPAVFIGVSTSMFSNYYNCVFDHRATSWRNQALNIPSSDSLLHNCTGLQYDVFDYDPDFTDHYAGYGQAFQGPNKPDATSAFNWLSGPVPNYNVYRYTTPGTHLFDTDSGWEVEAATPLPTDGTKGAASQSFLDSHEVQINGIPIKLQRWAQVDGSLPSNPQLSDYLNMVSVRISPTWGSGPNAFGVDANPLGMLIFNPQGCAGGAGLAGSNYGSSAGVLGYCVGNDGTNHFWQDLQAMNGHSIALEPGNTSGGWPFMNAPDGTDINIASTSGNPVNVNLGAVTAQNGVHGSFLSSSAATYNPNANTIGGQGSLFLWNLIANGAGGRGATEFVNVNPNVQGGFRFWDTGTGGNPTGGALLLDMSSVGATFGENVVAPSMTVNSLVSGGGSGSFITINSPIQVTGNSYLVGGMGVGNGAPIILYPSASGQSWSILTATAADSITISTHDNKPSILNLGVLNAASAVSASGYTEKLFTPASSSAACTAGQFADDANYHYVCVSQNSWKRAALSAF